MDITERKRTEQKLAENERNYRTLVENLQIGLVVHAPDTSILYSNSRASQLLGLTADQLRGKAAIDPAWYFIQEDGARLPLDQYPVNQALTAEAPITDLILGSLRPDREGPTWAQCNAHQVFDLEGKLQQVVVTFADITERKQAELKLKEYSEHLEELVEERTRELREAQETLIQQERLAVLGRLSGGVAHELRNPLGVINNANYYLRLVFPQGDEKIQEYLSIIETEVYNADKIVCDLLDFSNIELADREPIAVSELVRSTLERFPTPENVQVKRNLPQNLPTVSVDPRQMTQVLEKLMLNACQAMPKGGKLTLSAKRKGEMVAISVQDTGVGITPENMNKLFEPLFSTKPRGIGLGLVISQKLAEANGGRIEVQSEAGKGSMFTVFLPVKP